MDWGGIPGTASFNTNLEQVSLASAPWVYLVRRGVWSTPYRLSGIIADFNLLIVDCISCP